MPSVKELSVDVTAILSPSSAVARGTSSCHRRPFSGALLIALFLFGFDSAALGKDTLGDFEKEANKSSGNDSDVGRSSTLFGILGAYEDDESDDNKTDSNIDLDTTWDHFASRRQGGLSAPLLRLESSYQALNDADVDGYTVRGEVVWGSLGVGGEILRYREGDPHQEFELGTAEFLYRIAPNEHFRFLIASGVRFLEGRKKHAAYQGGVSIGLYPQSWWGLEFDTRYADVGKRGLGDYRLGALLRIPEFRFAALRFGYRAIDVGSEVLHGGEIGAVITF
jgi:hypothetical protein